MFPTSLQHPYAPRGRRRGRNDPNSRDYICPCGKSYLSYPALFTHIKIKHNGRAPGQIIKPKSDNVSKRGRPRQKQVYDSESDTNDIAANCIDRLCDFVTEFEKPEEQKLSRKLREIYTKDGFYKVYVNYNPQEQEPRYNEREDLYDQQCDNVFCQVIAQVNKRLNQPYHIDVVIMFFMMLGNFINSDESQGENIQQPRNQNQYYNDGEYIEEEQNQDDEYNEEDEIVEEEEYEDQENQEDLNQNQDQNNNQDAELKKGSSYEDKPEVNQDQNIPEQNKSKPQLQPLAQQQSLAMDPYQKLKQQPIRNIVNYINNFILLYSQKYYTPLQLKDFLFFEERNVKLFIELFFNWLTNKKYINYKVKINHAYMPEEEDEKEQLNPSNDKEKPNASSEKPIEK